MDAEDLEESIIEMMPKMLVHGTRRTESFKDIDVQVFNEKELFLGSYDRNSLRLRSSEDLLKSYRSNSHHSAGHSGEDDEQGTERCEEKKVTDEAEVPHSIKVETKPVKIDFDK